MHGPLKPGEVYKGSMHYGSSGGAYLRFHGSKPDTSLHYQSTDTGLVHRAVCLFTPQLSLVLTVPTHGGMARLS